MNKKKILSMFLSFTLLYQFGAIQIENVNAVFGKSVASKKVKKISTFKKAIYLTNSIISAIAGVIGIKSLIDIYREDKAKSSSCSNSKTPAPAQTPAQTPAPSSSPAPNKRKLNVYEGCNGGIRNIRNSCYMNAMLQILYDIEKFRKFIFSTAKENVDGISEKDFEKIKAMDAVFKHMSGEQSLDDNALNENIYTLGHEGKPDDCNTCTIFYWCEIINKFAEKFNIKKETEYPFNIFNLCTLDIGDKQTTFSELLENKNIDINSCIVGGKFMAWINRVKYDNNVGKKITTEVKPDEVTKYGKNYKLTGVIVHHGTLKNGHYYSYKLNLKNNEWYEYNDSIVTRVDWGHIKNNIFKNATLFLYSEIK